MHYASPRGEPRIADYFVLHVKGGSLTVKKKRFDSTHFVQQRHE